MKTWVKVVVWLVVAALVVTGAAAVVSVVTSGSNDSATPGTPVEIVPQQGSDVAPEAGLASFYGQRLEWNTCRGDFVCADLTVPLDYADPAGATITIAVLRVAASGERIGSLVINPGGPGAPGTDYATNYADAFGAALHERYDIVGFDPRGAGGSAPIDCLSDAQLTAYLNLDPDPDTAAEEQESFAFGERFGAGCVAKSGAVAAHVSTDEAARDMDILRSALGENTLTYLGASYGTKLGATYADLFPTRVGRLVLDGAIDPTLGTAKMNLAQASGFQTALDAYVDHCLATTKKCFLGTTRAQGEERIARLLADLDADPIPTSGKDVLTEGEAFLGIALPLYARDYWVYLSQGLKEAFAGSGETLQMLADSYASKNGSSFSDNSMEAIYAINCLDDPWALHTTAEVQSSVAAFEQASPTFGRIFAWMGTACAGSQVDSPWKPRELSAVGAAPIVVVGTTRDPATPYAWSQALATQLDSGVLVSRDGDGHTGYHVGNSCVDDAVEGYLIDGTVPSDGLTC